MKPPLFFALLGAATVAAPSVVAVETPRGFSITQTTTGVSIEFDGTPFAGYVIDQANKPCVWPIVGPTGKPMTRGYPLVDLPSEPEKQRDHPHHRGLTFGHEDYAGDTWHDRSTYEPLLADPEKESRARQAIANLGSIRHRTFTRREAGADQAVVESLCDHLGPTGRVNLTERRRLTFRATAKTRSIDIDQDLVGGDKPVRIGDRKDAGLFIRVPVSMAVDSKEGGRIVTSEGAVDADAWSKPARWCDYHGPVDGETLGIAFLDHPSSFRHPTRWHARTYGLFSANPFASQAYDPKLPDATITLAPGETLRLRHRLIFHSGDEREADIEAAWQAYANETPPENLIHSGDVEGQKP
ncbi:MAG: PmoA family protein [Planctomycetia bacterium]